MTEAGEVEMTEAEEVEITGAGESETTKAGRKTAFVVSMAHGDREILAL